jgi:uncharacterized protein with PIN domain
LLIPAWLICLGARDSKDYRSQAKGEKHMTPDQQQVRAILDEIAQRQADKEFSFCPRCGKRLATGFVEISIHTCTPPKETK